MDEIKRKKRALNREYAKKSRLRKQKQLEDLAHEVNKLQSANKKLVEIIKAKEEAYAENKVANNILRTQTMELADRLRFLNSIIQVQDLKP
uniref:Ocs element-binding factor 1 n=1 Tax=Cajanus cajan TaxID=3821 RepID=A0A151RYE8_CAJCA|nr:Ocs element-binding factor 1 [Cajanus cajan]